MKNKNTTYKGLMYLLCFTLLTACAFRNTTAKRQDAEADNTSWELAFKFVGGKGLLPHDKLSLNGRIPKHLMYIDAGNLGTDRGVIFIKYDGIGRAKIIEVCDKLNEDKGIKLLSLTEIEFR